MRTRTRTLTPTEAAYLAGVLDSEGTVTVMFGKNPVPRVLVVNGDALLIGWIREVVGAGYCWSQERHPGHPNWSPMHRFCVTGLNATALLGQLLPYLRIKRERAELAMALPIRGRDFVYRRSPEQDAHAAELARGIRLLNAAGSGHRGRPTV